MENTICPKCKSKKVVKRGSFSTQAHGQRQRYFCKDCKKKFIRNDGFYRMKNNPHKITLCLDLFFKGVSTRKIQEHLQAFYPNNSSNVSIYNWIIKYSRIISSYTNNLKVNSGSKIQVDEVEFKRRKYHNKEGTEQNWFIDSIDLNSRYIISSEYFKSRGKEEIKKVINDINKKTDNRISTIATDGLNAYDSVLKKIYGYNKRLGRLNINHKKVISSKTNIFNYEIERLHNSIRQLTQNFRGFHGSLESARAIMKGYEVYYNFIRKHQGINCYPYELATDVKLKDNNKWLELINLSN
jgi:putative transposase